MHNKVVRLIALCLFILTGWAPPLYAQFDAESVLMISNYSPELEKVDSATGSKSKKYAQPQFWSIAQDHRGIMYFAGNDGVLEYDGSRWQLIKVGIDLIVRSLAVDEKGRIYVGAHGDFGFLQPDEEGELHYRSLKKLLPEKDREFGDIWRTLVTDEGVYFQANEKLFLWDGNGIKVWNPRSEFQKAYWIHNRLLLSQHDQGIFVMEDGKLENVLDDSKIRMGVEAIIPYDEHQLLLVNDSSELSLVDDRSWQIRPFPSSAASILKENRVYNMRWLDDRYISLGTWGNGIVVIDKNGRLQQVINKKSGLQIGVVHAQFVDDAGNLWLALAKGIARLDIKSPMSVYNDRNGLEGSVQDVARFNGCLYAGTLSGVFALQTYGNQMAARGSNIGQAHFAMLKGLNYECWAMLPFSAPGKNVLLLGMNDGIHELDKNNDSRLVKDCAPYSMLRSSTDTNRVYIGVGEGLFSLYWDGARWIDEGMFPTLDETIFKIYEGEEGDLWLGTMANGIIHIARPKFHNHVLLPMKLERFGKKHGLLGEDEPYLIEKIGDRLFFASYSGLYTFDEEKRKFIPSEALGKRFSGKVMKKKVAQVHRIKTDPLGHVWMVNILHDAYFEVGFMVLQPGKQPHWESSLFSVVSKRINHVIYHENYGVTWIGGDDGLFRFDVKIEKNLNNRFQAFVRKVTGVNGKRIFMGANYDGEGHVIDGQPSALVPVLPFSENHLSFEFAAPQYEQEKEMLYRYKLMGGEDENWSDWVPDTEKEFNYLPEGDYKFHVKAKNIYGRESEEAVFAFTVLPPWYRTYWAYGIFFLAFVAFVYGAVTISTRSLKSVIRERTAEVVKQKEIVEEKNRDILDSIKYAKRIQEAILPPNDWVERHLQDFFIIYKPKDIVSGDFYYMRKVPAHDGGSGIPQERFIFSVVDCTGHGVPGAFMSIVGHNSLNQAISVKGMTRPAEILDYINHFVTESLGQERGESSVRDGMDISLCSLDLKNRSLEYAGAFNPLYIIRNGELLETKADKHPIGGYVDDMMMHFTNHKFGLQKGDSIYVFSDGFADQFGGPEGKKFKYKPFKEMLLSVQDKSMKQQGAILDKALMDWMGDYEQVDDICVIGIRV